MRYFELSSGISDLEKKKATQWTLNSLDSFMLR